MRLYLKFPNRRAVPAAALGALIAFAAPAMADEMGPQDWRAVTPVELAQAVDPDQGSKLEFGAMLAQAAEPDVNDPIEGVNRAIFNVNEFLYSLLLRPLAELYVLMIPEEARDGIRNVLVNVKTPVILANDVLQGEFGRAWITTERFFINSTLGVGGIVDVADRWDIKGHTEDLGQTFAVWGVPEGFYLVLPILGPSNPRDAVGMFLDSFLDPLSYYLNNTHRQEYDIARTATLGFDEFSRVKDELQKLKETSIDYYAALRSISRQKRNTEIRNGKVSDGVPLPDLKYDFNAELNAH